MLYIKRLTGSDDKVSPHISRHKLSLVNRLNIINFFLEEREEDENKKKKLSELTCGIQAKIEINQEPTTNNLFLIFD